MTNIPKTAAEMALLIEWKSLMAAQIKACKQRMDRAANYDDYIPASNEHFMLKWKLVHHNGFAEWAAKREVA